MPTVRQPTPAFAAAELRWLVLALALHALLLLLPVDRAGDAVAPATRPLQLELWATRPPAAPQPQEPAAREAPGPSGSPVAADAVPPLRVDDPAVADEPEPAPPVAVLSTARLLDAAAESALDEQGPRAARRLGMPLPRHSVGLAPPGSGSSLGRSLAERFAPQSTVLVDRWFAADGSHNVVMNLPNGETLCGRAEAWDALRPLIEPVMMFRRCGGGGTRTFRMPVDGRPSRTLR